MSSSREIPDTRLLALMRRRQNELDADSTEITCSSGNSSASPCQSPRPFEASTTASTAVASSEFVPPATPAVHLFWRNCGSSAVPVTSLGFNHTPRRFRSLPPQPRGRDSFQSNYTDTGDDTFGGESANSCPGAEVRDVRRRCPSADVAHSIAKGRVPSAAWTHAPALSKTKLKDLSVDEDGGDSSDGFCGGAPQNERHLKGLLAAAKNLKNNVGLASKAAGKKRWTWPHRQMAMDIERKQGSPASSGRTLLAQQLDYMLKHSMSGSEKINGVKLDDSNNFSCTDTTDNDHAPSRSSCALNSGQIPPNSCDTTRDKQKPADIIDEAHKHDTHNKDSSLNEKSKKLNKAADLPAGSNASSSSGSADETESGSADGQPADNPQDNSSKNTNSKDHQLWFSDSGTGSGSDTFVRNNDSEQKKSGLLTSHYVWDSGSSADSGPERRHLPRKARSLPNSLG